MKPQPTAETFNPTNWPPSRSIHQDIPSRCPRRAAARAGGASVFFLVAWACAALLMPPASRASELAYEGFNYNPGTGNLTGQSGGFGWRGAWTTANNGSSSVQAGSLTAGASAPAGYDALSGGNAAFTPNGTRAGRFLDTSAGDAFGAHGFIDANGNIGAPGKTIYISFLQQPNAADNNYYEFEFHRGDLSDPGRVAGVGNDTGGSGSVYLRTPSNAQTLIGPGSSAVSFYVVRIDFGETNDTVTVYQNPTSATEPASVTLVVTNAGDLSFNGISFGAFVNGRTVAHDEIRLGETWADVVSPAGPFSAGDWDGGGADGFWSTGANWDNEVTPVFASTLTFAGSAGLNSTNDLTGVSANNLVFDAAAGAFTLAGNSLGLNGNIRFNGNPAAPVTQTINLPLTPGGNVVIDTRTNGNFSLNGGITGANTEVTQTSAGNAGVLTLGGTNALKGLVINGGTNRITGTTAINGIGGSSFFYLADGNPADNATLIIESGAHLSVSGGFQDAAVIGRDGGVGTVIQNGGTFSFDINDGAHESLFVGASGNSNTRAEYDMNGGVLDMNDKTLGIALGANTVITGLVNQVGGVITNVGTLYFNPFFTQGHGIYNLTGGSIYIGAGGITNWPGSGYELNLGGGTIGATTSWNSSVNMNLTGVNGPVTFNPGGNTIGLSGILSGSGGLTVAGGGILELSGPNTYTGDTTIAAGGTLQLDATGSAAGAIHIENGGMLNLNYSGTFAVGSLYTNGVALPVGTYNSGTLPGFIGGYGDVQVTSGISTGLWTGGGADSNWSTAGNWDNNAVPVFPHALTFAGNAGLTNNNDLSGVTVSSLTFAADAGPFEIDGNDLTLGGSLLFSGVPAAPVTQTVNLGMNWPADQTVDTPTNANLTLGGNINSVNRLAKTGAGTLTLGGLDSFAACTVNGGTNVIAGNVTINGTSGDRIYVGDQSPNDGNLVIENGAALTVAGSFDDALVIGRDGGSGAIIQNGGTFTFSPANQSYLFVGATSKSGTRAEYDMNGGVLEMSGYTLGIALGDNGVNYTAALNQTGGEIDHVFNLNLGAIRAYGHGVYNLSGGTIQIDFGGITSDSRSYEVNLGGGTVAASSSWSSSLNMNLTNLNGSVTFDTAGNTITLSGILSGNGGFTVNGYGVLELANTNTYTGDTRVNQGTLQLDSPGGSSSPIYIVDGSYLNLNYTGTFAVPALYTNGVAVPVGIYNASSLPGFLLGSGDLQVSGVVFSDQPQSQVIYLNENNTATLTSAITGGTATYQWYQNDQPVNDATNSSLTLTGLQIAGGGDYYVVASGSFGSVTSSVAALTIYAINNHVFAYDGFAYPSGSVDGASQDGGFGWDGPWQQVDGNGVLITDGNLTGGANVPAGYDSRSISNCIEVPSNAQTRAGRFFDCSSAGELYRQGFIDANGNIGADGKTIYLSFLQQPDRTSGFYEMEFHRGNLSDPGRIGGIGNDTAGSTVNLRAPNSVNNHSLGAGTTDVNLYVVRIDYKPGNDDVFVYRNPASDTEPATPTLVVSNVADMSFNGVSVAAYNGPDVKHDEIRLGATWADAIGLAVSNLLPPTRTANGYQVRFACTPGYSYRIQRAADVNGPWTDLSTNLGPANAYLEFEDTNAPSGQAFYRTVTP